MIYTKYKAVQFVKSSGRIHDIRASNDEQELRNWIMENTTSHTECALLNLATMETIMETSCDSNTRITVHTDASDFPFYVPKRIYSL